MLWARWIIYGIPVALALLTAWSAHQAAANRAARGDAVVIASAEGIAPTLNPFFPACEVDRRVAALVHQPLLRIGPGGRIAPALVEKWSWSQTSSVWFAGQAFAKDAAQNLAKLDEPTRESLGLQSIELAGTEIRFGFSNPGAQAPAKLLPVLAAFGPLPVEFIRVDLGEAARGYHEFFMANAIERDQVKRVWFDGVNAYELAISGETVKFAQELNLFYQNRPALRPRVRSLGSGPMLHAPVLELTLKSGVRFTDGDDLEADDAAATLSLVLEQPWPVPGRDALRLIAGWERPDPRTLKVMFKEVYGPSLTAFIDLPVLPANWIARHSETFARGTGRPFLEHPPPGAGTARVESADAQSILVDAGRRVEFLLDQLPDAVRMGFAMRSIDGFWPQWRSAAALSAERGVILRSTPPRSRLLILWNCRKPPLDDARVRAALGLAVDRPALVRDLLSGQGTIHDGIYRPGLWFAQDVAPSPCDAGRALRELRERGWSPAGKPLVKDGKPFRFELLTVAGNPERARIAEALRKDWAALGIEVTVTEVAQNELVNPRLTEHRFDAALIGLDFETTWDQSPYWHSSQARGGLNFSGLADPTLDGLLEALRVEYDLEKVPPLAHDAENRIISFHPFLPLFSGGSPVALRRETSSGSAETRSLLSGKMKSGAIHLTMTRLRHPPSKLAPRVLALCLVTSLALLWHDGATPAEAGALVITTLPLDPDGTVMLRVLLGKVAASFILISCSLATGLSFALALAMGASWLGGRAARFTGWIGRMLAGVPPMGWALGAIVWLIQRRGLPVETLFPYEPPPESDTLALRVGRTLWAWIVPVLVLAIPALGRGLFSLAHKLSSLLHEPVVDRLRARGLRHSQILYRHLVPILRVQLARLARPAAALLLAFDIPVEELLGFDGWGRFAATTLLSPAPSPHALAAVFWAGGLLLAGVLGWLSLLDRQGLPQEAEQDFDPTERRSMRSACCGAGLILALLLPVRWFVPENLRRRMEDAFVAQSFEILRALGVSLAALALVVAASFLMNLLRSRVIGRGWAAALALMPLLAVLLFWDKACGRQGWAIVLVVAIPGFVASREVLGDADESDFIEASRSLGQTRAGIWWRHVLPGVLPSLPGLALRNAGTVMMMFCVLDFYAASGAASWGGQMRLHTGHILDDALPALAPAVLLMLLGLSFRLLSRAFGDGPPSSGARPLQP